MAYYEHLGGRKYRLCTNDPSTIGRKRVSLSIEVPSDITDRKLKQYLDLELATYAQKVESGQLIRIEKMTVEQFIPKWKKGYADLNMGEYTRRNTTFIIDGYIKPVFGSARLDQIKPLHLVTFFADLKRKDGQPMATNTRLNIYKAAKSVFDAAHKWKLIAQNPMHGVDRPSVAKKEKREMRQKKKSYTRHECETVISALYSLPDRWRLYYVGAILGGFRRGEMLAVEWPQVDLVAGGLHILKQITFDEDGNGVQGELKSESSEGFVPMPKWYMLELEAYKREWNKEKLECKKWLGENNKYVFHSGKGEAYYPNTPSLTWRRFLVKHKLPIIRLHDLRHTTAMLLREEKAETKTIQERLRHARSTTTENMYMHESELVSRDAADRLESLNPKKIKLAPRSAPSGSE